MGKLSKIGRALAFVATGGLSEAAYKVAVKDPKEAAKRAADEAQEQTLLAQQQAVTGAAEQAAGINVKRRQRMRAQSLLSSYAPDQANLGSGGVGGKTLLGM